MSTKRRRDEIRTAPWLVVALVLCALGGFAAGFFGRGQLEAWVVYTLFGFAGLSVVALADAVSSNIAHTAETLDIATCFRRTSIAKTTIAGVSWEKGAGVYLKLTNGKFQRLPETGHNAQGVANSVRAWLKPS